MTQLFLEDGTLEPATVLKAGPCVVVQAKTAQTDGYEAVQIGFVEGKKYKANKPTAGHYKKANVPPTRVRREVGVAKGAEAPAPGAQVLFSIFNQGERVDVVGTSKGHGFQGVVKRHHFARRRQVARLDVPSRAGFDWRLVVSVASHARHARARAHGCGPRDGAQPEGAEDRHREQPAAGRRATCPAPTAVTWSSARPSRPSRNRSRSCRKSPRRARSSRSRAFGSGREP